jgi:large subunit ribosomal protein L4
MKYSTFNSNGTNRDASEYAAPVFEGDKGLQALKEVVVAQAANARQGTRSAKTRAEVRGGGKKPWRQKGTGRARHGSTRSPIWVGGGVVFGPRPRDFSKKINKQVKELALRRAFFDRSQDGSILVIQTLESSGKTRELAKIVTTLAPDATVLLVDVRVSDAVARAASNLPYVAIAEASGVNPTDLCRFDKYIITEEAMKVLVARLGGNVA